MPTSASKRFCPTSGTTSVLDPLKHEVRFTLAGCLVNLGRHAEAGQELDTILAQDPRYAAAQQLAEELKRIAA